MKEKYFKNAPDYAVGKLVAMNKCSGSLNTKSDLNTNIQAAWSNSAYRSFNSISKFPNNPYKSNYPGHLKKLRED